MMKQLTLLGGGLILASTVGVLASPREHTLYLTFDRSVAIPGATLTPGAYIFEEAAPQGSSNVVRVLSRDRSRVFLTQFATRVERPAGLRNDQPVLLGEAAANELEQIVSWFEPGVDHGYAFDYRGY
jgi:hypothetical protein